MGKYRYYAVANGHQIGIYSTWNECQQQINGYKNARYKGFQTKEEAQQYIDQYKRTVSTPSSHQYHSNHVNHNNTSPSSSSSSSSPSSSGKRHRNHNNDDTSFSSGDAKSDHSHSHSISNKRIRTSSPSSSSSASRTSSSSVRDNNTHDHSRDHNNDHNTINMNESYADDDIPLDHIYYTDGAAPGNGKINGTAGWSFVYGNNVHFGSVPVKNIEYQKQWIDAKPTNIRGEGLGILNAMKHIQQQSSTHTPHSNHNSTSEKSKHHNNREASNNTMNRYLIVTDSQFWIDMIHKYIPSWIQKSGNSFDWSSKKNSDLCKEIWQIYNQIQDSDSKSLKFQFIRSHQATCPTSSESDSRHWHGNRMADEAAVKGALMK